MPLITYPFLLTAITYFVFGAWIIASHKNKVQLLFGVLCIATCFWQGLWVILFSSLNNKSTYIYLKLGYTGVVFIPAIVYQFVAEFTESKEKYVRQAYAVSLIYALLIWYSGTFINGFHSYTWGLSAKAGFLHPTFAVFVLGIFARMMFLFIKALRLPKVSKLKTNQALWGVVAFTFYSLGSCDLISNYGISLVPFSPLCVGIALICSGYAMFRFELLTVALPAESGDERSRRVAASLEMKDMNMMTSFPLVSQGELLGYLLLGEKMSEESYSKEDLLLLRIIANQAALAYQRVRYLEMAVRGARTEMLGEIAGGFAHEIKTPLANISLPAELCFIDLTDVEQGKRKIEDVLPELKQRMKDIMQQTFKASDKIEAIRQFSKPGQIRLESVDLAKVIQNSISLLEHLLHKAAIDLQYVSPDLVSSVRGNAKQLEIVFVNLIKNAAEAMVNGNPAGLARILELVVVEEGSWVVVRVKDSGPGIKRTDVGHLFEAYFTTKGSSGTGMGLFLSHQVVKAHGGAIEVKSVEGKGTEFIVRLPKYALDSNSGVKAA